MPGGDTKQEVVSGDSTRQFRESDSYELARRIPHERCIEPSIQLPEDEHRLPTEFEEGKVLICKSLPVLPTKFAYAWSHVEKISF